ncbi:MAG: DNA helicase PcrA [Clostridia bacterium]|nr:DNA helicase PcrA [Clostridia bacterium]MDQ7791971.1 DNA helicase PcrA [Clostridia bacterium]
MYFADQLNPAQATAVNFGSGPLLVLAGAGSGKTRVLTYRVAHLVEHRGVDPRQILAITFTNKAAREMRDRIGRLASAAAPALWVSTFHAACLRILRRHIELLGYNRNFGIYDEGDQQTVVKECLKELFLDPKRYPPNTFLGAISWQKNLLVTPEAYARTADGYFEEKVASVYRAYQEMLERNNALDFDDLLMLTVRLFQEQPDVLAYYQERFQHVLVDEYQDTNHVQYMWIHHLAAKHRNLTVVGDPDQGIYGWRGADINNILNFERDHPDAKVITLEQNYRSTTTILDAANSIIRHNTERKEKRLVSMKGLGTPITLFRAADEILEARFVAERIRRLHRDEDIPYRGIAVLYRTNAQSRILEEVLLQNGIAYTIVGGTRFYERKEIKDTMAYLRAIVNPADTISLSRIINTPRRGIGKSSLQRFFAYVQETGITPTEALLRAGEIDLISPKARREMINLGELFQLWRTHEGSVTELVRDVLESTGYRQELLAEKTVEAQTRLENLDEFLSVTRAFDGGTGGTLDEFMGEIALFTDLDSLDDRSDQVTLMTLHSAKGLEFPAVFLSGMEEGVFPHSRAFSEPTQLEEERRLCYVGVTRAEERLHLTYATRRTLYGNTVYNQPSRFLAEIPGDLIEGHAAEKSVLTPEPATPVVGSFKVGEKVWHRKWGQGTVVMLEGEGDDARITVAFPGKGVKTLLLMYAPLEKAGEA